MSFDSLEDLTQIDKSIEIDPFVILRLNSFQRDIRDQIVRVVNLARMNFNLKTSPSFSSVIIQVDDAREYGAVFTGLLPDIDVHVYDGMGPPLFPVANCMRVDFYVSERKTIRLADDEEREYREVC